jgi:hypothetical protein
MEHRWSDNWTDAEVLGENPVPVNFSLHMRGSAGFGVLKKEKNLLTVPGSERRIVQCVT